MSSRNVRTGKRGVNHVSLLLCLVVKRFLPDLKAFQTGCEGREHRIKCAVSSIYNLGRLSASRRNWCRDSVFMPLNSVESCSARGGNDGDQFSTIEQDGARPALEFDPRGNVEARA